MRDISKHSEFRNPRVIALIVASVVLSALLHLAFMLLLTHGLLGHWLVAATAALLFALLYGCCALAGAVVVTRTVVYLMAGLIALMAFMTGFSLPVLIGSILEFCGFAIFTLAIQREAANRIRLSLAHVMAYRSTLGIAFGLAAVSCIFYGAVNSNISSGRFQDSVVNAGVSMFDDAARLAIKSYTPTMTVDDVIRQQIPTPSELVKDVKLSSTPATTEKDLSQRLSDAGIDPKKVDLTTILSNRTQQETALLAQVDQKFNSLSNDIVASSRQQVSDSIGVQLNGDERADQAVRDILAQRISKFTLPQLRFVPLILTATFFLTLMLFNWLFTLLAVLLARFLLFIGVHSGAIETVEETVTATRLRFK